MKKYFHDASLLIFGNHSFIHSLIHFLLIPLFRIRKETFPFLFYLLLSFLLVFTFISILSFFLSHPALTAFRHSDTPALPKPDACPSFSHNFSVFFFWRVCASRRRDLLSLHRLLVLLLHDLRHFFLDPPLPVNDEVRPRTRPV